jgi:hypothetical protein
VPDPSSDPPRQRSELAQSLLGALSRQSDRTLSSPHLLPTRLAMATAEVLPVDGASISVASEIRVPLGASDDDACTAERLQFTLGEGPCLSAVESLRPQIATEAKIAQLWPSFYEGFASKTPYRSVASVPLAWSGQRLGAVDVYWTDPDAADRFPTASAEALAGFLTPSLLSSPFSGSRLDVAQPAWLGAPAAQQRMDVWKAIGLVSTAQNLPAPDALAAIRAFAYARDTTVDEVSGQLLSGSLAAETLDD